MSISSNISFFAQSTTQSGRLADLRATMDDLQRQATTQKKFDNFSDYGTSSLNIQRLRTDRPLLESYLGNIEAVSTRMDLMSKSLTQISEIGTQMVSAIQLQLQGGEVDMDVINQQAQTGLQFIEDLINQELNGHYLFAGSDVTSPPFIDDSTLNSNFQNQITSWLAGGVTNAQLFATTDAFTAANLGFSSSLATAGTVTARIDHNLDIDYTLKADQAGFQDIVRALSFAANLRYPDSGTDVATQAQFSGALDHVLTVISSGVSGINDVNQQLASKFNLVKSIKESQTSELNLVTTQIDKIENVDLTTVLANLQAMQTQLSASYQVTSIVSQLSLVNFL